MRFLRWISLPVWLVSFTYLIINTLGEQLNSLPPEEWFLVSPCARVCVCLCVSRDIVGSDGAMTASFGFLRNPDQKPVLKTTWARPNSLFALLKERVCCDLKRLKNRLLAPWCTARSAPYIVHRQSWIKTPFANTYNITIHIAIRCSLRMPFIRRNIFDQTYNFSCLETRIILFSKFCLYISIFTESIFSFQHSNEKCLKHC